MELNPDYARTQAIVGECLVENKLGEPAQTSKYVVEWVSSIWDEMSASLSVSQSVVSKNLMTHPQE